MPDTDASAWPDAASTNLKIHLQDVRRLLKKADPLTLEHPWYHAYNTLLSYNAMRMSDATNRFSIYPQAKLPRPKPVKRTTQQQPRGRMESTPTANDAGNGSGKGVRYAKGERTKDQIGANEGDGGEWEDVNDDPNQKGDKKQEDAPVEDEAVRTHLAELSVTERQSRQPEATQDSTAPTLDPGTEGATSNAQLRLSIAQRKGIRVGVKRNLIDSMLSLPKRKVGSRYPDFSVILTALAGPESDRGTYSMHSVWELKAPPALPSNTSYMSPAYIKSVTKKMRDNSVARQVLQQAQWAFAEYTHQKFIHILLGYGYLACEITFNRAEMPDEDFWKNNPDDAAVVQYVKKGPVFFILEENATDYSDSLKDFWMAASVHAKHAADSLPSGA
ncbi:hypothetical protein NM688_g725 [Phlebia brevispora]|uniref:Uncharacterized protein n=1 Tax=Phlebia brevispora TaxID=194682 RepID=A0ACC1TD76_9APHY|nr:hypothetical protein NM688_g725 [Phlebia brevispora]